MNFSGTSTVGRAVGEGFEAHERLEFGRVDVAAEVLDGLVSPRWGCGLIWEVGAVDWTVGVNGCGSRFWTRWFWVEG